jgi:Bifunctional DNA primase/polymerase, N-terminal/Primase C terminal 1 (PriCT-1)
VRRRAPDEFDGKCAVSRRHGRTFALWQPAYAERHIATFPLHTDKRPAIRGYQKVGLRASRALAEKFAAAPALGFMCGPRNKVTVLDCDTTDETVLSDALIRHGATPLIVRTASGKWHAYYKHNGERRRIRPWAELPIDILGARGFVVAPPSRVARGRYQFVDGSLDDFERLPVMRGLDLRAAPPDEESDAAASPLRGMREHDGRNAALFQAIAPLANEIFAVSGARANLLDLALAHNQQCAEPMAHEEVNKLVNSVWRMTLAGRNQIGQHVVVLRQHDVLSLIDDGDQDALVLLSFLHAHNGPAAPAFWIANGLADTLGWTRRRLSAARKGLLKRGYIVRLRRPWRGRPAEYGWQKIKGGQN